MLKNRKWIKADDFGLYPEINKAITELAEKGILSHVSCLVGLSSNENEYEGSPRKQIYNQVQENLG